MGGADRVTVVELNALFELGEAHREAAVRAIASYRAVLASLPPGGGSGAVPAEEVGAALAQAAGGDPQAVSWGRVARLVEEHLLGAELYAAAHGVDAADAVSEGTLRSARPRLSRESLVALKGEGRLALAARMDPGAVLYLLARDGLSGAFDAIVAREADPRSAGGLSSLVGEAVLRLVSAAPADVRVMVAHRGDAEELERSLRWSVTCVTR